MARPISSGVAQARPAGRTTSRLEQGAGGACRSDTRRFGSSAKVCMTGRASNCCEAAGRRNKVLEIVVEASQTP